MDKSESSRQISAEYLLSLMADSPNNHLQLDNMRTLLKKIPEDNREKVESIFHKFIFHNKSFEMPGSSFISMYKQQSMKQVTRRLTPQEKQYALSRIRDFMEEQKPETDLNLSDLVIREYTPIYKTFQSESLNVTSIIKTDPLEQKKHRRNRSDDKGVAQSFDSANGRHVRRSSDIGCWNFSDHRHINKIKQLHIYKNVSQIHGKYRRTNENTDPRHFNLEANTRNTKKVMRAFRSIINCN
jgi:hypothetical protein